MVAAAPTGGSAGPPVVAVLPLTSISGDSSKDFIAAGIAESLISSLAKLPTVTVLSRASVSEARGRSSDRAALAKDLGATYFVEGSVQESGGRLRVTLNLVRADQSVAWGDQMEGRLEKIFDLQSRLAVALSTALDVRVSPEVRQRMNARATASPDALTAYWQGRALLERRDVKGNLEAATAAFSKALTLDPRFALAHAALGEAYWHQYVETRDPVWAQRATDEGLTALRLDANEPAVRYTLAVTLAGTGKLEGSGRGTASCPGHATQLSTMRDDSSARCWPATGPRWTRRSWNSTEPLRCARRSGGTTARSGRACCSGADTRSRRGFHQGHRTAAR